MNTMKNYPKVSFRAAAVALVLQPFLMGAAVKAQTHELRSPDSRISILFETIKSGQTPDEREQLVYSVRFKDRAVVDQSALGLIFQDHRPLGEDVRLIFPHVRLVYVLNSQ
jgi:hypothetical protein